MGITYKKKTTIQAQDASVTEQYEYLTFVYPCIASIIVNDDQQDATILAYIFIPNQLYMFRAMSSAIIRTI
jgi:hypothetical protein